MANLKNYRKLIELIKTIDLNSQPDYEKSEKILNKAIGELMVLKPEAIARVLRELNEMRAKFLAFYNIKNYWQPENFDFNFYDGIQINVELYKRFLFDSFTMKWKSPEAVMDLKTMDEIVWKAKYNSTLLFKIKKSIAPEITIKQQIMGFQGSLTDEQIEKLYSLMQGFIDATPANFRAIFKDEPLPPGFIPIKRKKIFTSSLCAYFISGLFQKDNPGDYWSIAENCFDVKNLRKSFNNAIQYNTNEKPKGFEKIDTILQNIYTPLL